MTPDDLVTVLVTTSPAPLHPSTEHIEETIDSVRQQLPLAEIVIVCDGVRPEQEDRRADYEEYLRRLALLTEHRWRNVLPIRLEQWGHQAHAVRAALGYIVTPQMLFMEHDTPLVGDIDWECLCMFVASGEANMVEFLESTEIHPDHQRHVIGAGAPSVPGMPRELPVLRWAAWWQRPHLASTRFYRDVVMPRFTMESRTMIEDLMYGALQNDLVVNGAAAWHDWRVWAYAPQVEGDYLGMKRSRHLDSRGDAPKYEMKFT